MSRIQNVKARQILDSRGDPTVEVDVILTDGTLGRAAAPSGASTGTREAVELRDKDPTQFNGKGVTKAVCRVHEVIAPAILGKDARDWQEIDEIIKSLDKSPAKNKAEIGANATTATSLAVAKAAAAAMNLPLYKLLGGDLATTLPVPLINVLNGGKHADNNVDFQEFMIVPVGANKFIEAMNMACRVYKALKAVLKEVSKEKGRKVGTGVGDEGGFAPDLDTNEEAVEVLLKAIVAAGFEPGRDVAIAFDPAASELHQADGSYFFWKSDQSRKSSEEMVRLWKDWFEREWTVDVTPPGGSKQTRTFTNFIVSLEDGLGEQDPDGWVKLTAELGSRLQLVGDDVFVTNPRILRDGIERGMANAILIKVNQIGTLSETIETIDIARAADYGTVVSHRSGETEDATIAHIAVGTGAGQIKTGSVCRTDRTAKYNELLRIEEELGCRARYPGMSVFKRRG